MAANEKYRMFKNYMLNELGISRDDIHDWVKTSIQEEVEKIVQQTYGSLSIEKIIKDVIYDNKDYWVKSGTLTKEITETISKQLIQQLNLEIELKTK